MADKLVNAVLHFGKSGMEVVAERNGKRRKVDIVWHRKVTSDVAPPDWPTMVTGELDFQDSPKSPIPG